MRSALCWLALGGWAVCGLTACGLFEPRESEAPLSETTGQYLSATSPENVLHNLQEAFGLLEVFPYLQQLADSGWIQSFEFVPDAEEYQALSGQSWGRAQEEAWLQNLANLFSTLPGSARHRLDFDSDPAIEQFGDSALFVSPYTIVVEHSLDSPSESFAGTASLVFARNGDTGDWGVIRWRDQAADTSAGATALRVAFRGP